MRGITKYDMMFFCEVLLAVIFNSLILHLSISIWMILVLVGLLFELLTRAFWTYSEEFQRSLFTIEGMDVSLAAAVSWAGVLIVCLNFAALLVHFIPFPYAKLWASIIVVGVIGNLLETICVRWGMFRYEESWVTRMIFLKRSVYLWNVPVSVRLGYFLSFGPLAAAIWYMSGRI